MVLFIYIFGGTLFTMYNFLRVNYKFCPLCLHQISGAVLLAKSLQAVSFTFQNLECFVLYDKPG
ncbi:hypothetical protein Hanom_Chr07g00579991 [Helianthus anomalus]